ncbi:MAG: hypothetical protein AVDCRST_MAG93-9167 [uncultured Chloroflexia bacterium]|uniref:Uncharacterized protein n=1 Tax=uncultured Chloroflexia bacterium TaxID=1672391 RepID=A0A6J4N8P4_9CHLR|nr:MAG: hypothetical protein AVDCRST_MAG93-9167 [uncultured Chloroflexia bacterium]
MIELYTTGEEPPTQNNVSLTLLFRVDRREECEALHTFRAAFGVAATPEAITEYLVALHLRPGHLARRIDP